jgi:signal transduction histidine kinase
VSPAHELPAVLAAFDQAVQRLEQSHHQLHAEVSRLTAELEIKNRELARQSRLADLGRVASHVAHEIRNSMVPVKLYLSLLERRLVADADARSTFDKITGSLTAVDATVDDLLHFASDREPAWDLVSLHAVVDDVCQALAPQFAAQRIRLELDVPRELVLRADRNMLRRGVLNLALNALDAMPDGGRLFVTAHRGCSDIELEVADTGRGLSAEAQQRAFEPFFTTKSHGTGLGLAIVYHVAQLHGGTVTGANCPEGGAAFTLRFPLRVPEAKAA